MNVPIRIYFHVTTIGAYYQITKDIFDCISDSGLLEEAEGIFVGVLGDESELPKLRELLENYPKTQIVSHSTSKDFFEFFTIEHLKHDADTLPKFFALYLHSKGVTSANENDALFRKFWRDAMSFWMITNWRQCYHALNLKDLDDMDCGYDACSIRVVPARKSINHLTHGSGNFHWSNSEYVKTLPLVTSAIYGDGSIPNSGHYAEMWMWSGQPVIYTPCNMFQMGFPYQEKTFKEYWEALPDKEKYVL